MPPTSLSGVESALPKVSAPDVSSNTATSVNVPPMSAARRMCGRDFAAGDRLAFMEAWSPNTVMASFKDAAARHKSLHWAAPRARPVPGETGLWNFGIDERGPFIYEAPPGALGHRECPFWGQRARRRHRYRRNLYRPHRLR